MKRRKLTRDEMIDIINRGDESLKAGNIREYWALMAQHDPYAVLAGNVANNETAFGKAINNRLERKVLEKDGRQLTDADKQKIRQEIAGADLDARKKSLEERGSIQVTNDQAIQYHNTVFNKNNVPTSVYLPAAAASILGADWANMAGQPMIDTDGKSRVDSAIDIAGRTPRILTSKHGWRAGMEIRGFIPDLDKAEAEILREIIRKGNAARIERTKQGEKQLEQDRQQYLQDALRADEERYKLQPMDFETAEEYEQYRAQLRGSDTEQKQATPAAPDADPAEAAPEQHGAAGDMQQQGSEQQAGQQLATADMDAASLDAGSMDGNNGRNYAAALAALPVGREVSLNWLLQKDPSQWSQQELDDAQASNAYWNSRNPRHDEVQGAVSDVYGYLYGNDSRSFRPDGSLPRAEPVNRLPEGPQTLPHRPGQPEDELQWRTLEVRKEDPKPSHVLFAATPQQAQRQAGLADLGALMEDIPPFDGSEAARTAPARYLQQALNTMLWPGRAAPDAASIQGRPYRNGPIVVDGEIGPVTTQALDQVEAQPDGLAGLSHGLKRNAARDIAQQLPQDMPAETLAGYLDQAVNIFRDMNRTHESSVQHLQKGLNQLGQESTGLNEAWQPIAEDGQLGPVTASSFASLARRLPADSMASLFDLGTPPRNRTTRAASQMQPLSARDPNPRNRMRAGML